MNKATLVQQVADRMSVTQRDSLRFINTLQEIVASELKENSTIMLQGFGTFSPWEQTERTGRNPRTGIPCTIPSRVSVKFKPGKQLLEALNDTK